VITTTTDPIETTTTHNKQITPTQQTIMTHQHKYKTNINIIKQIKIKHKKINNIHKTNTQPSKKNTIP